MEKMNEKQGTGLQLSKTSTNEVITSYFKKVLELKQSGKEFPINLDDVWPLVYNQKGKALETLKSDFVEGEDFNLSQKGKVVKFSNLKNGVRIDAFLTVACMEYFIAKKVKPVFEVYRQVFHRTIEEGTKARQLEATASASKENSVYTVKMGDSVNQVVRIDGVLYAKMSPVMRYMGYTQGVNPYYIDRVGRQHFRQVTIGTQKHWFFTVDGFDSLLRMTTIPIKNQVISSVYRDVFGIEKPEGESPYTYRFTDGDMLEIVRLINSKPIHKEKVMEMLFNGRR